MWLMHCGSTVVRVIRLPWEVAVLEERCPGLSVKRVGIVRCSAELQSKIATAVTEAKVGFTCEKPEQSWLCDRLTVTG